MAFHMSSIIDEFISLGKRMDSINRQVKSIDEEVCSLKRKYYIAVKNDCRPVQQSLQLLIEGHLETRRQLESLYQMEDQKMDATLQHL